MTDSTWRILVEAIRAVKDPPGWLGELTLLTHAEISHLAKLDNTAKGDISAPSVREIVVTEDYLDFLREQIRLSPRGPEWTEVLKDRMNALQPFVGKKVLIADFYRKPNSATLYINPETQKLFHVEI